MRDSFIICLQFIPKVSPHTVFFFPNIKVISDLITGVIIIFDFKAKGRPQAIEAI
jgi:hypothetical protein